MVDSNASGMQLTNAPPPDPMADLFSGNMGIDPSEGQIPDDIQIALDQYGIEDKRYQCMVKRLDPNMPESRASILRNFTNEVPTIEYMALNYGPGDYLMSLIWYEHIDGKKKHNSEKNYLKIDDAWLEAYEAFQLDKQIKHADKQDNKIRSATFRRVMRSKLNSMGIEATGYEEPKTTPTEGTPNIEDYIAKTARTAELLGFQRQVAVQPNQGFNLEKVIGIASSFAPLVLKMMEMSESRNREFMAMMMKTQSDSNNQLVELMKTMNGPTTGKDAVKEFKDMLGGVIDIKQALEGNKSTVIDKILDMVQGIAPALLEYTTMTTQQRQSQTQYRTAQMILPNLPDVKEVMSNPALRSETIHRLDEVFGWLQTDIILEVLKTDRPRDCPRDPVLELSIDERNNLGEQDAQQNDQLKQGTQRNGSEAGTVVQEELSGYSDE